MTTTNPKQHIHHDMIVEWAKNPSRKMQFKLILAEEWIDVSGAPNWSPVLQYRFKPETVTITYRKGLFHKFGMKGYVIINIHGPDRLQTAPVTFYPFIKWLGDPVTETIEL